MSWSALMFVGGAATAQGPERPPAPVIAETVVSEKVAAAQTFVGTVMPVRFATIGSAVDGRVIERPFEEGDRVEAKQKLVQLMTDTISLELAAAESELELRKQQLAELKNGTRPEEIAQAKARLAASAAREKFLLARQQRVQKMYRSNSAATEDELEEAVAAAIEAQQVHIESQAVYDMAVAGPRKEVIAQAEAQVAIQQAIVERLADQRTKHTIISRFAGYVTAEHTEIGQWVNRGDPVADVAALDEVEVVVQVVERSVPFIHAGSEATVEIPALAERGVFVGIVITAVPQADIRARTFPVKVRIKNEINADGPLLKAGMYARAALPVGAEQLALMVPKDAIVLGGARPMVYVVDNAMATGDVGIARPLPVELGVAKGRLIQVTGELAEGQMVVVQGNERLQPGQPVVLTAQRSAAAEPQAITAANEDLTTEARRSRKNTKSHKK
jgi:RND family efflux transporter MFP subunit